MHPVERAQENAEADFVATIYGLLQAQAKQVLALLRQQTARPLSDPRVRRLLNVIVAGFVQDSGQWHAEWIATLSSLYLGIVGTTRKLLAAELPSFALDNKAALDATHTIALDRAEAQARVISQTIASDFARLANQTAALEVEAEAAPMAVSNLVAALQGAMLAPNALNGRATRIAGTEAPSWLNQARAILVDTDGHYTQNTWRTELDELVRPTHAVLEGVRQPIGQLFENGCEFPGDTRADPSEFINCRCFLEYS